MRAPFHITESPTDYTPSERLDDLLIKALKAGHAQESDGSAVVPMLIAERAAALLYLHRENRDCLIRRRWTRSHNPPMQWTEPAGKLLVVREPARCRLGH